MSLSFLWVLVFFSSPERKFFPVPFSLPETLIRAVVAFTFLYMAGHRSRSSGDQGSEYLTIAWIGSTGLPFVKSPTHPNTVHQLKTGFGCFFLLYCLCPLVFFCFFLLFFSFVSFAKRYGGVSLSILEHASIRRCTSKEVK